MARILAALSGGVDSSVAAAMLVREGHDVVGAYMKNWINEENIIGHCPWQEDIEDARAVADQLGIEFHVVNLMKDYRELVVKYLLEGYQSGITPNPDVMCNREMKFGVLWDWAKDQGFESIATGHYARKDAEQSILRGLDPNKDQTYFLAMMRPEQVQIARFPIGHLLKPQLRDVARELNLKTADKKDSQGICFIGEVKMEDFLRTFVPDKPGPIVTLEGKVMGQHKGLHLYTLGQRKGIGIGGVKEKGARRGGGEHEPWFVARKDLTTNTLYVVQGHDHPWLLSRSLLADGVHWCAGQPPAAGACSAKTRYRQADEACRLGLPAGEHFRLDFDQPQWAVTPGQSAVLYDGEVCLGGGFIAQVDPPIAA